LKVSCLLEGLEIFECIRDYLDSDIILDLSLIFGLNENSCFSIFSLGFAFLFWDNEINF
jgi:hypothetical protein